MMEHYNLTFIPFPPKKSTGPPKSILEHFTSKAQSPVKKTIVILETSIFFPKFSQLSPVADPEFSRQKTPERFPQHLLLVQSPQPRVGRVATDTAPGWVGNRPWATAKGIKLNSWEKFVW